MSSANSILPASAEKIDELFGRRFLHNRDATMATLTQSPTPNLKSIDIKLCLWRRIEVSCFSTTTADAINTARLTPISRLSTYATISAWSEHCSGNLFNWLRNFVSERTHQTKIGSAKSTIAKLVALSRAVV